MILTTEQLLQQNPDAFKEIKRKAEADERRGTWLAKRRGRITASSTHKLFTKRYETADNTTSRGYINEIIAEGFGSTIPHYSNKAMQWGNDNEVAAVKAYMENTGNQVEKYGDEQEFVTWGKRCGATPDGLIGEDGTLQVKCPYNPGVHVSYLKLKTSEDVKDNIPEYYIQMQMEILCTGRDWCDFVSFDPRTREDKQLHVVRIQKDEPFQRVLIAHLTNLEEEIEKAIDTI